MGFVFERLHRREERTRWPFWINTLSYTDLPSVCVWACERVAVQQLLYFLDWCFAQQHHVSACEHVQHFRKIEHFQEEVKTLQNKMTSVGVFKAFWPHYFVLSTDVIIFHVLTCWWIKQKVPSLCLFIKTSLWNLFMVGKWPQGWHRTPNSDETRL